METVNYDVVIIGGAFSGATTGLLIKRKNPNARVLIIEKNAEFDRKVGESTTEVSSCFMTRILGIANYLGHEQLAKQGLRMWFCHSPEQRFDDCVEIGPRYSARVQTFQVDRAKLDSHLLGLATDAGCDLWRPAKVTRVELDGANGQTVNAVVDLATVAAGVSPANGSGAAETAATTARRARARWLVDASGRATMLARKLGVLRPNEQHPINSVWARFTGVKDWDSYDWRENYRDYMDECRTARSWATNHLMGHGWWCWIIPLRGGDVSAGIVYDNRIFKLPEGANLAERLHAHLVRHPVGREIFRDARAIEGDVHALSMLPYHADTVCGDGWAMVGDAAGFIDPLYSPGLDFCSYTGNYVADFVARDLLGENVGEAVRHYREQYPVMYRAWFETLYQDKYFYMGDAELMTAALLLDVASYYFGLVIPAYQNPERAFLELPFRGTPGRVAARIIKFYNRRLVRLAKRRLATGEFGKRNAGWRELYDGFVPDFRVTKLLRKGLWRWWKAELTNLRLMFASPRPMRVKRTSAVATAEA